MNDERWLPIPGYDGYEVSDQGRVRSVAGRLFTPRVRDRDPYPEVQLRDNERRRHHLHVHTLVLAAFVGPRPEGLMTRHLNGDCTDNRRSNLKYGTSSENAQDAIRHGTRVDRSTHCGQEHEFSEENTYWEPNGKKRCRACQREKWRKRRTRAA